MFRRPVSFLLIASLALASAAPARDAVYPVIARHAMVVAPEPRAADVGLAVLARGGNAFDAAVAIGFLLAVTHPLAGNLGGGGFAVGLPADGPPFVLDFRETAPGAAHRDLFLDERGDPVPGASTETRLAVGVPGTVDGLLRLLETYGSRPRADLIAPAIEAAWNGVTVGPLFETALASRQDLLARSAATRAIFFRDGEPFRFGDVVVQEDLARTLEAIAALGRDGFYAGDVAGAIAADMREHGGLITEADLAGYRAVFREPFRFVVDGNEFLTPPLPSSGGIVIAEILGLLGPDALDGVGWHSAEHVRRVVEAERLAFADRSRGLGDPAFVDSPVAELLSAEYLAARRELLPAAGIARSADVVPGDPRGAGEATVPPADPEGVPVLGETCHFCVVDALGNVVSVTTTLNSWFGCGAVVAGGGFFLNNEMDDFTTKPGASDQYGLVGSAANEIAPGKRPLSSMTPTIVRKDGEFVLAMGAPGGSTIITTLLQIWQNLTTFDMNVREAVDAPRFHHQWWPDKIYAEPFALSSETRGSLEHLGYVVEERTGLGRAMAITRTADGRLAGWADRRSTGRACGQ